MSRVLDIVPLRSLIAVADAGGFHRAAADLQLSQSAVSQHIRRLEKALGRPLVEPDGRPRVRSSSSARPTTPPTTSCRRS
jgi:DNA-binding transcriptional LysR family regulator